MYYVGGFHMKKLHLGLVGLLLISMLFACGGGQKKTNDKVAEINVSEITLDDINRFVDECISLLEGPVPERFELIAPNMYQAIADDDYRILISINDQVIAASFSAAFAERTNAARLNELFHTFFENSNWEQLEQSTYEDNLFLKDDTYVAIDIKQEPREDERVVTYLCFTKDFTFFSRNFIRD